MQELFKNAVNGLPPWDQRAMALHSTFAVDDVNLDALAEQSSSKDTMISTENGRMKHLWPWQNGAFNAGAPFLPPNCATR